MKYALIFFAAILIVYFIARYVHYTKYLTRREAHYRWSHGLSRSLDEILLKVKRVRLPKVEPPKSAEDKLETRRDIVFWLAMAAMLAFAFIFCKA